MGFDAREALAVMVELGEDAGREEMQRRALYRWLQGKCPGAP
jgi:hypothetical protein